MMSPINQPSIQDALGTYSRRHIKVSTTRLLHIREITHPPQMPVKRSLSSASSDSTSTPEKAKKAKSGKTDSPGKTASTWTAESKAILIEQLLTVGFAQASMSDLAAQVGWAELGVELHVWAG